MNINITFLIQIINFWITYAMLSRFLLKPFVIEQYRQRKLKKEIAKRLLQQDDNLKELIAEKNKGLLDFKLSMKASYSVDLTLCSDISKEPEDNLVKTEDVSSIGKLIDAGSIVLTKKITDAYRT